MESNFVVYVIKNTANGKLYVGQTCRGTAQRWREHRADAKRGSPKAFHVAIREYGPEVFVVDRRVVLGRGFQEKAFLNKIEKQLIDFLDTTNPEKGYNSTYGASGDNRPTLAVIAKQRLIGKQHWENTEYREKTLAAMKSRRRPPPMTEETRNKLRLTQKGRKCTPEQLQRMRDGRKGKEHPNKGKKLAASVIEKMRVAALARWQNPSYVSRQHEGLVKAMSTYEYRETQRVAQRKRRDKLL